jgi:hypothetical protein
MKPVAGGWQAPQQEPSEAGPDHPFRSGGASVEEEGLERIDVDGIIDELVHTPYRDDEAHVRGLRWDVAGLMNEATHSLQFLNLAMILQHDATEEGQALVVAALRRAWELRHGLGTLGLDWDDAEWVEAVEMAVTDPDRRASLMRWLAQGGIGEP